ncbi:solute carrier family 17 member 9 [Pontoporia blainvillei]|uniref:Solute carrier family 17 member 9 n=1 Tax=Pontoporia blainvillei TaxID=48723 RepID=A0ABX0SC85_PONBL|nr:solute carrier family 17 member 9 [Pontoporia blainvillei]
MAATSTLAPVAPGVPGKLASDFKKCTELQVKFDWGQNEGCSPGDSISEKLLPGGEGRSQDIEEFCNKRADLILALGVLAQGLPVSRHTKVPWRQLFRKPSVWAAIISQLSAACSFFILLSWLPTFFKETFPSSKGWVFNVVPWLVAIPASLFSGLLSDRLINQAVRVGPTLAAVGGGTAQMSRQDVSWSPHLGYRTITVRKFMQAMGLGLSSVFALCLGHTSSFCKSVVFASASIGLQTFNHSGISVNIQDLAPSCAGFLFGVANTAGALAGVVGVCLGGYLIETTGSWTSVFNLVAAISSLGLCTFLVFGKAQRVDLSPAHEDL